MFNLPRIVVNPKTVQGDIVCTVLDKNMLYGMNGGRKVGYNVITGQVFQGVEPPTFDQVSKRCTSSDDKARLQMTWDQVNAELAKYKQKMLEGDLNDLQTRVLVALANHQVSGDQMSKGLKAFGVNLNAKFVESFLGGWIIESHDGEVLDLETLLQMIP
jgi:hypothetical protein